MGRRVSPPPDLGTSGRELWAACLGRDEALKDEYNPMRRVLLEACRVADHLDELHASVDDALMVQGPDGLRAHPGLAQIRTFRALLVRLLGVLRMPDPVTGKRPQSRGGFRRNYSPRG
ncbi:MAG: hypothetical protein R2720_00935 [Candidatus Nanopelagicales bacterium]